MMDDEDFYDFGGDWGDYGAQDVGAYPAEGGNMNLSPNDPASAYYTGPGSGYNQSGNQGLQGLEYEMAPGTGMYDVGQGWQGINTGQPPDAYYMDSSGRQYSGPVYNQSSLYPGNYGVGGYSGESLFGNTFGSPSTSRQPSRQPTGPSQGARNVAQQTPQMISLGQPERTAYDRYQAQSAAGPERDMYNQYTAHTAAGPGQDLYKRYKSLLMNPDFSGDPTYQFLYNQGLQGLNRNLAARRMTQSGKNMNDTMAYGSGMASRYMQDLLPQYRGGAQEELNQYLGQNRALGGASGQEFGRYTGQNAVLANASGQELNRFMEPAGLLPRYAGSNNETIAGATRAVNNADDRAMYADMLSNGDMGGGGNYGGGLSAPQDWGAGIGYGGRTSGYTTAHRLPPQAMPPARLATLPTSLTTTPMRQTTSTMVLKWLTSFKV